MRRLQSDIFTLFIFFILSIAGQGLVTAQPTVRIVTIGPGEEVYELEGHTLLRINDGDGTD